VEYGKINSTAFLSEKIEISRIKHGKTQTINTLIEEEVLLFANYLRNEVNQRKPRLDLINKL
jgi:hypothetical protein